MALEPNGAFANEFLASSLFWAGRSKEAIPIYQKAIRLNPLGSPSSFAMLGSAYSSTGLFEEAVSAFQKTLRMGSGIFDLQAHLGLAVVYMALGREKEARAEAAEVLRINPKFKIEDFVKALPVKDPSKLDKYIAALRKAGLK